MSPTPEQEARTKIDEMLAQAGWLVQDMKQVNLHIGRGVAIREFPLKPGHGEADYLLYVDGQAAGVVHFGVIADHEIDFFRIDDLGDIVEKLN